MNATKLKRLRAAGWKVGSARDFLKLSDEEAALVELKLSLAGALKQARQKRRPSQADLAQRMGSSQSRVAKIEAGDPSVTIDLMVRAILATGALSKFVERAVRKEVLAQTAAALKASNQDVPYARLQGIIDEALVQVRSESGSRHRRG